ncbi:MAG: antitermination protein NusG [Phycisphaerae bacterium]|jgi:transcription antitermination factor NusG|nr:antitermination protein NusG [Phycisphaerae bacterium]
MEEGTPAAVTIRSPVERRWMVLHTRARQEKAVARHLDAAGVKHDLPLVERVTMTRGRKHRSEVPLFSNYVFVYGEKQDAYDAISTRRVVRYLEVEDQAKLERELQAIHTAIRSGLPIDEHPGLAIGQRARVVKGPLAGVEGFVIDEARRSCLILHVETLGRGASVEIERDLLEPIED